MFGVPAGYRENPVLTDLEAGFDYWTPERLKASERYQWGVYAHARDIARRRNARTVLDVGCGPATKLELLFGELDVYGVDQPGAIDAVHRLGRRGTFASVDLSAPVDPPFEKADIVICSDVIEHLGDPRSLLELVRAECGGVAVLSTPARDRLGPDSASGPTNPAHVREWTQAEFAELLSQHGLRVIEQRTQVPFRLGLDEMTARWLLDAVRNRRPLRSTQVVVAEPA